MNFTVWKKTADWPFNWSCDRVCRSVEASRPTSPIRNPAAYRPTPQRKPPPKPSTANIYKVRRPLPATNEHLHSKMVISSRDALTLAIDVSIRYRSVLTPVLSIGISTDTSIEYRYQYRVPLLIIVKYMPIPELGISTSSNIGYRTDAKAQYSPHILKYKPTLGLAISIGSNIRKWCQCISNFKQSYNKTTFCHCVLFWFWILWNKCTNTFSPLFAACYWNALFIAFCWTFSVCGVNAWRGVPSICVFCWAFFCAHVLKQEKQKNLNPNQANMIFYTAACPREDKLLICRLEIKSQICISASKWKATCICILLRSLRCVHACVCLWAWFVSAAAWLCQTCL